MANQAVTIRLAWKDPATGGAQEKVLPLPVTIGRDPDNTIVLPLPTISRHHARLDVQEGQVVLVNLSSGNAIWVEGKKVAHTVIKSQAQFELGPRGTGVQFTGTLAGGAAPASTAVVCHNCGHTVDIRHYDCPWCGFSLTGARKKGASK